MVKAVRKSSGKRPFVPRKAAWTALSRVSRFQMSMDHKFTRWAETSLFIAVNPSSLGYCLPSQLALCAGYTDFSGLYDQYKIISVEHVFALVTNPNATYALNNTTQLQGVNFFPNMWHCEDLDDGNNLSLSEIKQYKNAKVAILKPDAQYKVKVTPAVLMQTYQTALSTGYAPKKGQWIDIVNTTVPHYGVKVVFDCCSVDPTDDRLFIRVDTKYNLAFRAPR